MPDKEGFLTEDERDKINAWFAERWHQPVICPISKDSDWHLGQQILQPNTLSQEGGFFIGGATVPSIFMICGTCGYTMFFNAVMMGLVPSAEEGDSNGDA